ncbi:(2Fe-2S)-binding protein [Amycolatopsis sp. cmx-4-68]|uniref:(2Fe-2S)-binding protein n=1 Tax=Amycolatopsis sp. cmx-4-68 TaxID=2790938 RepID=UPI00397C8E54
MSKKDDASSISRRGFLVLSGAAAALPASAPARTPAPPPPRRRATRFAVNGRAMVVDLEPRVTLLDFLRDRAGLTGAKKGCNEGACGTCTVLVDGQRMNSCLTLAVQCDKREVTTIEGLAEDGRLDDLQQAFIEHDAFQCGYCTPGQIVSARACIAEGHAGSEAEVREWMSGNICRCAAYPQITAAVLDVAAKGGPR